MKRSKIYLLSIAWNGVEVGAAGAQPPLPYK
jgi:hypothetical protein